MNTEFKPGTLVTLHKREWVVLPSDNVDILLLKPLGGTDREIKGVHRSLEYDISQVERAEFPLPTEADLGDFASARLLFEAARLSFRSGAGPFRSMGRLAFQPRAYQLVPLIMALRLQTVRLLIADDAHQDDFSLTGSIVVTAGPGNRAQHGHAGGIGELAGFPHLAENIERTEGLNLHRHVRVLQDVLAL